VLGLIIVPLYLRLLGREGYGLAGFYVALQAWMLLFDAGLSPAISRQLSRFNAGALQGHEAAALLRAAEGLFLVVGVVAGGGFFLAGGWIARHWLGASTIPPADLRTAIRIIAFLLVCRWMCGMYQSALVGLERQISLNTAILFFAIVRAVATILALMFISRSPVTFFAAQALTTLAETVLVRWLLARAMPPVVGGLRQGWALVAGEVRFAGGLAISSAIGTTINQVDKLALSHVLPLSQFGIFSLVVAICAGIAMFVPPFLQSFQPRLTGLMAQGRRSEFVDLYRLSASVIVALLVALAGTIAAQPELVIYAWTGSRVLGEQLSSVLTLYALGSGIASFLFVPFMLQYAQGLIRLHVIGNLVFGAFWIPSAVWAAFRFGAVGTGMVWLVGNALFLLIWVTIVHRRLLSPGERRGLGSGLWLMTVPVAGLLAATRLLHTQTVGQVEAFALLVAFSVAAAGLAALLSSSIRAFAGRVFLARSSR
jgi:O-antigen/teichoic acid export membrane protein